MGSRGLLVGGPEPPPATYLFVDRFLGIEIPVYHNTTMIANAFYYALAKTYQVSLGLVLQTATNRKLERFLPSLTEKAAYAQCCQRPSSS